MAQFGNEEKANQFFHHIFKLIAGQLGKLNTVWLRGPASCGKTTVINSICDGLVLVGSSSMLNTQSQFPYNDCLNKNVYFFDELLVHEHHLSSFLLVSAGHNVLVNAKYRSNVTLFGRPVFIATNGPCLPPIKNASKYAFHKRIECFQLGKPLGMIFSAEELERQTNLRLHPKLWVTIWTELGFM